jgi:hypothetical protein
MTSVPHRGVPKLFTSLVNDLYSPFDTFPFTELPIWMPQAVGTFFGRIIYCIVSGVSTRISEVP